MLYLMSINLKDKKNLDVKESSSITKNEAQRHRGASIMILSHLCSNLSAAELQEGNVNTRNLTRNHEEVETDQ